MKKRTKIYFSKKRKTAIQSLEKELARNPVPLAFVGSGFVKAFQDWLDEMNELPPPTSFQ